MTKGEETKIRILEAGVKLWPNITARAIGEEIGLTHPLVAYHFGKKIKEAVAAYAVETGKSRVIAQLIATKHPSAHKLTPSERQKHMDAAC